MITLNDLNTDVLADIASELDPLPPPLRPHWNNLPTDLTSPQRAQAGLRALRATCHNLPREIHGLPAWLIFTSWKQEELATELEQWSKASRTILNHVRAVTIAPTSDSTLWPVNAANKILFYFINLLGRTPRLERVELKGHFLCTHASESNMNESNMNESNTNWELFGIDDDRAPFSKPELHTLDISLRCKLCTYMFSHFLGGWCTTKNMRYPLLRTPGLPWTIFPRNLTGALYLKLDFPVEPGLLAAIAAANPELGELYLPHYDDSRKVQVLDDVSLVLQELGGFRRLHSLDMCVAKPESEEGQEELALSLVEACPSLKRGWWWTRVGDLDYNQLQGYYRQEWRMEDTLVVEEERFLAPLVVRNEDGQGKSRAGASELWH